MSKKQEETIQDKAENTEYTELNKSEEDSTSDSISTGSGYNWNSSGTGYSFTGTESTSNEEDPTSDSISTGSGYSWNSSGTGYSFTSTGFDNCSNFSSDSSSSSSSSESSSHSYTHTSSDFTTHSLNKTLSYTPVAKNLINMTSDKVEVSLLSSIFSNQDLLNQFKTSIPNIVQRILNQEVDETSESGLNISVTPSKDKLSIITFNLSLEQATNKTFVSKFLELLAPKVMTLPGTTSGNGPLLVHTFTGSYEISGPVSTVEDNSSNTTVNSTDDHFTKSGLAEFSDTDLSGDCEF